MGKRSPILGYNHNVRYRGLVFHVQSEDSGVASPHLFTHLFHHGVIVSTRKLVYDAGSAEESIKSLMQAQHKAVLKDLRRGHFDDKIDSYLGGTPGLLPRGTEEGIVAPVGETELATATGTVEDLAIGPPTEVVPVVDEPSMPVIIVEQNPPTASQRVPIPVISPSIDRLGDRSSPLDLTLKTEPQAFDSESDSAEIEIELEVEDGEPLRGRRAHDTETQVPLTEYTRPTLDSRPPPPVAAARRAASPSDGVPGPIRPAIPLPPDSRRQLDRPSTINAATLPPARPISRPPSRPAVSPPTVVSRPVTSDDRSRRESEAIEVYSPAPPSAELPGERPGQYSQHKRVSTRIPIDRSDRPTGAPVPAGLGRPQRAGASAPPKTAAAPPPPPTREPTPRSGETAPLRARAPTPPRLGSSQSPPATPRPNASAPSGVVMTRPAVIVGAPSKSGTIPRIRKAREDEGRGFGQGLISEKSLDEVILAYLSEDADEK